MQTSNLHDGQIRDIIRRPELFFSTSTSLEEALILLIAMRRNFTGKRSDILPFREAWLAKELKWCPQATSLHETLKLGGLDDIELHRYLLSRLVRDFDESLYAERESFDK